MKYHYRHPQTDPSLWCLLILAGTGRWWEWNPRVALGSKLLLQSGRLAQAGSKAHDFRDPA